MNPEAAHVLVVGASHAGVQLAVALREQGHHGPVTLVGAEDHRPYQRPPLSKDWLLGKAEKDSVLLRSDAFWAERDIRVLPGERVVEVDRSTEPAVARTDRGTEIAHDRLVLATGARARALPVPGGDLEGVLLLRDADDALELRERLPDLRRAVVVGGGFIGLEVAAALRAVGAEVVVLESADRLLARACGPETAQELLDRHRADGIDVRLGARVTALTGERRVTGVRLGDDHLEADLVVVGVGVVPATELAESLGLVCDDGVRVDERALASDGLTLAVGDVANQPHPAPGAAAGSRVRLESVSNTLDQAAVAAATLLGRELAYPGVPWFWSTQGAHRLQIAGVSHADDERVVRRDPARGGLTTLYYRDGRLVAADTVDAPAEFVTVKKALAQGATIPRERAADVTAPLRTLVEQPVGA
ncbi:FAD-dependent oxidoreductase [Nocardioides sp. CFH 31398]|uniref:NAD(P)/FAD-dependent oxidoreductase n=1 Tax=Nocardioides sp. CFH 31398 TaxID=2919579 RepID=UPI001F06BBE9|nr:FAD-dependent oxidoreductase [Nocardioides sp. CFH 31398]MCH1865511.1 FAD-dependent oxidoreductase [Nocardioides sp. CFH 31398]